MKDCSFLTNPEHWRARAAAMRLLADQADDDEAKTTMLEIATAYDKLTRNAEQSLNSSVPRTQWGGDVGG
jgi:hypothetical protein